MYDYPYTRCYSSSTLEQQAPIPVSTVNKTADLYRISATDLTVQRLFQERFGDPTSADM